MQDAVAVPGVRRAGRARRFWDAAAPAQPPIHGKRRKDAPARRGIVARQGLKVLYRLPGLAD